MEQTLLNAVFKSRPHEFPCFIQVIPNSNSKHHHPKTGHQVLWIPCPNQNTSITLKTVEEAIRQQWNICIDAQTLILSKESQELNTHHPKCNCTCHGKPRYKLNTKQFAQFSLRIDMNKLVNKTADACFKRWMTTSKK